VTLMSRSTRPISIVPSPSEAQARQLEALIATATLADGHEPLGEHKFLRLQHGDDLARAVVALVGERLAGYAHTLTYDGAGGRRTSTEVVVHPEMRRHGIGSALLAATVEVARAHESARVDLWSYNHSAVQKRMAEGSGFVASRTLLHLHRHMRTSPATPGVAGVSVRAFRPGEDDAAWLDLNAKVFRGHPEQADWTNADLRARFEQPWFDAGDFLLAERGGALVGFNWVKLRLRENEGQVGEVYVVGVAPEQQGRGIGGLLLARGLGRMRERGADIAAIYVDESNGPAVSLYEAMDFHHHHVDVCYSLDLDSVGAAPGASAA
jgi:mycothiol synthase